MRLALILLLLLSSIASRAEEAGLAFTGVNLAGGEFGATPGRRGVDYTYPSDQDLDFAEKRGFNLIRLPFLWERVQPRLDAPLDATELSLIDDVVARARKRHLAVLLDVHNYGRYAGDRIGAGQPTPAQFAELWTQLALRYANHADVIFGLMNEPYGFATPAWVAIANRAIAAIRATGAHNLVLAPGNAWTGAHSWNASYYGVSNGEAMKALVDPCNNTLIELHQYFDADSSGRSGACRGPGRAVRALDEATRWLRANKRQGFLAEFGVGRDPACLTTLEAALRHLDDNADVWRGWSYWAAGGWWGKDYPLAIGPREAGDDAPQLATLTRHLAKAPPGGVACRLAD